jgi:sigma-B regulation protein RsbU (phosphoserine phosphatase)
MSESGRGDTNLEDLANSLGFGFAVAVGDDWRVDHANQQFQEWFPAPPNDHSLTSRLPGLKEDRARRRIEKGRLFAFETEFKIGARSAALRTTLRQIEQNGRQVVLVETVDITKQKEQEHMLDSFSKLADRNKIQLEKANQALAQKTEELKEAFDLIKAQTDRMARELEVARQVQMNMLPRDFTPNHTECTVAGTLKPALEVGGDFFDFFYVDSDRLCFLVGDVSDKGAASGLFMAAAKTLIKAHALRAESTAGIVARVNRELSVNNDSCMFVTLFLAILDLKTGEVVMTNAGHNPAYRMRRERDLVSLSDRNGPPLGIVEAADYTESSMVLEPDDLVVVYSDGVTEAMDQEKRMFGETRLEELLVDDKVSTAESVVRTIADAVTAFEHGTLQSDDVTVIAIKYHGP